jgi:hypothetical protein
MREQWFIMSDASYFVNAGDIVSEKDRFHSGHLDWTTPNPETSVSPLGADRPHFQTVRRRNSIVSVTGGAGNMFMRAFVGKRRAG